MSLGLHENRQRRRRRFWWGMTKWVVALALVVAAGAWSYHFGSQLAEREVTKAEAEIVQLKQEVAGLQQQSAALAADLAKSRESIAAWQGRYEREVMVRKPRVPQAGADEERLAFLVSAADKPRSCDESPETKRFIVRTELQSGGANDAVSFGNQAITVTATGNAAQDANGNPEAWFDPKKPVSITFTHLGGKSVVAEGPLPLHYSLVSDSDEYRFSALPGARGFLTITADRCDYP